MPWRSSGSFSTSMPLNLTPSFESTCTTAAEKPHCGNTGVPFMKSDDAVLGDLLADAAEYGVVGHRGRSFLLLSLRALKSRAAGSRHCDVGGHLPGNGGL